MRARNKNLSYPGTTACSSLEVACTWWSHSRVFHPFEGAEIFFKTSSLTTVGLVYTAFLDFVVSGCPIW